MRGAGRRALVTGASSGIGAATARLLAAEGYSVVLLARRADALEGVRAELPAGDPAQHLCLAADVRSRSEVAAALETVEAAHGGLDLLVNCAGIGCRARVEELEPEPLRELLATNVEGLLLLCRDALGLLRRGESPVVVNLSSIVGRRGIPGQIAYAASKAAVHSIGEGLRIEWAGEGIAVCTLAPALTATAIFESQHNPANLAPPDLRGADDPARVARAVLDLDRRPVPELSLRRSWRVLGALSSFAPRLADRILVRRLGDAWRVPSR
ncbi:MAG: SDR family oxidoreductase [Planctomycetota bacterium]|jgi:NAD(P)-dependent dehydrogenase (short-subunit alcohol dehydrogenase family)|nr:SDR family oxidoreductase [Planctomycetota bacterium]MDP6762704.1 SDR family oxidoreductase [Planctomycetota bacterium]MDP6988956.1 SDR family oxidoreductase [Planctomycetota bacterium]